MESGTTTWDRPGQEAEAERNDGSTHKEDAAEKDNGQDEAHDFGALDVAPEETDNFGAFDAPEKSATDTMEAHGAPDDVAAFGSSEEPMAD